MTTVDPVTSFGALVRRRRKALDLTQADLARLVSCTESLIRKIEAEERRPSREVAERLADALQVAAAERPLFVRVARGERAATRLAAPEALLAPPAAPPPGRQPAALPHPPTPLVGREAELAALNALLAEPATRLVTLIAPGGMGKTRLALAAAAHQRERARFADGVWFVDLTAVDAPDRLAGAIAGALGLLPAAAGPEPRPAREQVLDYLRPRRLLLLLDNAEHLLDQVGLLADILRAAPGVTLLATSRAPLRLQGEHRFPVGGLAEPGAAEQLFLQAARRANPAGRPADELADVTALCRLVGGMPLALELAGAWAGLLRPAAVLAALRHDLGLLATDLHDVPERQRSIRTVLDATWRRLPPALAGALARLTVFRGGFTADAAAAVAGAGLPALMELAGAALLSVDPARDRYTLHELLRQDGAARLAADPAAEAAALTAHAQFVAAFIAHQALALCGPGQRAALAALDAEQENIDAAWGRAVVRRQLPLLDALADDLGAYYEARADAGRGEAAFAAAAAAVESDESPAGRRLLGRLLAWQSAFVRLLARPAEAEALARRCLALLTAGDDAEAHARYRLARAIDDLHGPVARAEYEASLALYRALSRAWEMSRVRYDLAVLLYEQDRFAEAEHEAHACLALREAGDDRRGCAEALQLLSQLTLVTGRLDEALDLARRALAAFEAAGDEAGIALGLRRLSTVLARHGRFAESLALAERSLALYQRCGVVGQLGQGHFNLSIMAACLGNGARAEREARAALAVDGQYAWRLADDYLALGFALLVQERDTAAEVALRESLARHAALGTDGAAWTPPMLATLLLLTGRHGAARALIVSALRAALARRAFQTLLMALSAASLWLAETGDAARAAEITALLARFPVVEESWGVMRRTRPRIDAALARLEPAEQAAAARRGHARDPWAVARDLLAVMAGGA